MRCLSIPVILSASLAAGACAGVPKPVEKPKVDVQGVALTGVSLTAIEGELNLSVFNPNMFSMPLQEVAWELRVGDGRAVTGKLDLLHTIPARDSAPVVGEVHLDARDAAAVARSIADGRSEYTVRGTLRFASRLGPIDVDFEYRGDFSDARRVSVY